FQADESQNEEEGKVRLDNCLIESANPLVTARTIFDLHGNPITGGDFDGAFGTPVVVDSRASASIEGELHSPTSMFMVEAGVPFQLTMDLYMTMGDPNRLGTSALTVPVFDGINTDGLILGGGGSFVVELQLLDDGTLSVIPEPASATVWLVGLVVSAGYFRRRGRCR
ncbi:MAG: hypothetical protein IIA67_11845, partial [Planctomycetes bacterium]|nr:hypothetical protein [Planctomycetota bacterium]